MTYVLEYVSRIGAGRFIVEGLDFSSVLAKANAALQGLDCTRATLMYSPATISVFDKGSVLASYTQANGWTAHEM